MLVIQYIVTSKYCTKVKIIVSLLSHTQLDTIMPIQKYQISLSATERKEQRTRIDRANSIKWLLDEQYPNADQVVLVCDNLNTHNIASLYEAFEPAEALRLSKRLEIHHTPKHGSWLDIAEIELSALGNQCLSKRRINDIKGLNEELKAWNTERNAAQKSVNWQFKTDDARTKLKRLYTILNF